MIIVANRPVTMASEVKIWPALPAAAAGPRGSPVEIRRIEAEVCRRFVQLSCAKMHASRQSRSGARLHKNLLILRLLAKARSNVAILPYECASLLRRKQYFNLSQIPYLSNDELPPRKHFHRFFANEKADLNEVDNDIASENESGDGIAVVRMECQPSDDDGDHMAVTKTKTENGNENENENKNENENENDDEDNFLMEISDINERVNADQQSRLDHRNANENETGGPNDEKTAAAMNCSSVESDCMFTAVNERTNGWPSLQSSTAVRTGLRFYERVATVEVRTGRLPDDSSLYYESEEQLQLEKHFEPELAKPWSPPADATDYVFELADAAIPSLQTVINNPVSSPLDGSLLASFVSAGSDTTETVQFEDLHFSSAETLIIADDLADESASLICDCELAVGRSERRKRKTAVGEAVSEKRYCDAISRSDHCRKCGGQILNCVLTCEERDVTTIAMLVPDIDAPDAAYRNETAIDSQGWLSLGLQYHSRQQTEQQQQQYFYHSATIFGHDSYYHTVANSNNNNNNIFDDKTYSPPSMDTGTSGWDQVVPAGAVSRLIGPPRGHFVGPLVGLVAETPYILMF